MHIFTPSVEIGCHGPVRPGNTVTIILKVRSEDGYLFPIEEPKVTVIGPNGVTAIADAAMEIEPTNEAAYYHTISTAAVEGTYLAEAQALCNTDVGDKTFLASAKFEVRRLID